MSDSVRARGGVLRLGVPASRWRRRGVSRRSGRRRGRPRRRPGRRGRPGVLAAGPGRPSARRPAGSPSTSVARPASALTPVSVPVLARTRPRPCGAAPSNRSASDPVKPATGSPVTTGAQVRVGVARPPPAARRRAWWGPAGCPGRARCRRAAAAPVRSTPRRRSSRTTPRAPPANEPSPPLARPTWWPSTSAASLSLTSRIRSTTCASGGAVDAGELGGVLRRAGAARGVPTTRIPPRAQGAGEGRGRGRPTGPRPGRSRCRAALVDPERGDRRDHALGDVAGRPVRVDLPGRRRACRRSATRTRRTPSRRSRCGGRAGPAWSRRRPAGRRPGSACWPGTGRRRRPAPRRAVRRARRGCGRCGRARAPRARRWW